MNCRYCTTEIENTKHLIHECCNVKNIWLIVENILGFTIQWNHVVVVFFLENNEKINLFNNMISFVACRIHKYKMYCRLEGMNEHEIGIRQHIKQNVIFMEKVFKYSKNSKHEKLFRKLSGML